MSLITDIATDLIFARRQHGKKKSAILSTLILHEILHGQDKLVVYFVEQFYLLHWGFNILKSITICQFVKSSLSTAVGGGGGRTGKEKFCKGLWGGGGGGGQDFSGPPPF